MVGNGSSWASSFWSEAQWVYGVLKVYNIQLRLFSIIIVETTQDLVIHLQTRAGATHSGLPVRLLSSSITFPRTLIHIIGLWGHPNCLLPCSSTSPPSTTSTATSFPTTAPWSLRTSPSTTPSLAPTTPPTWWTRLPSTRGKLLWEQGAGCRVCALQSLSTRHVSVLMQNSLPFSEWPLFMWRTGAWAHLKANCLSTSTL